MEFFWIFYLKKIKNPEKFPVKMRYFNAPALKDGAIYFVPFRYLWTFDNFN